MSFGKFYLKTSHQAYLRSFQVKGMILNDIYPDQFKTKWSSERPSANVINIQPKLVNSLHQHAGNLEKSKLMKFD